MATIIKGKNPNKPYTVRYQHNGRQREKSFKTSREARDFMAKYEHDSREQIFVDPREGAVKFAEAAERWVANRTGTDSSKRVYRSVLANHLNPAIGDRSLRNIAADRHGMEALLKVDLPAKGLSANTVRMAYLVVRAVVNDAMKAGKLSTSRINSITLPVANPKAEIVYPTHAQLSAIAEIKYGTAVWLMRGCGLRISEALAVRWENFNLKEGTLRITEQLRDDGSYGPLKHREAGEWRDVPLPMYVWMALTDYEGAPGDRYGYVFPNASRVPFNKRFAKAREAVGLPSDFTPHTLRHIFASVSLSNGVPITDVSKWLGHMNINLTYATYGHLVPSSFGNARHVLDVEYDTWKETS